MIAVFVPLGRNRAYQVPASKSVSPLLVRGSQMRQGRGTVFRQDRDRLYKIAFDLLDRKRAGGAHVVDPAGDQVLSPETRRSGAIGDVRDVDPDRRIEQHAGQVGRRTRSGRAVL